MSTTNLSHRRTQSHILFMAFAFVLAFLFITIIGCSHSGQAKNAESEEIETYKKAIKTAEDSGDYKESLELSKELYEHTKRGYSDLAHASVGASYAQTLILMGEGEKGKVVLDEILPKTYGLNADTLFVELYNGYGLYETVSGNDFAAAEYYLKALEHARKCEDKQLTAGVEINLSNTLASVNDTSGLRYALEALQISEENGYTAEKAFAMRRISSSSL